MEPTLWYAKEINHRYKVVTWKFGHVQQPAIRLFVQNVFHANNNETRQSSKLLVREIDRLLCTPTINVDVVVTTPEIIKYTMTHSNNNVLFTAINIVFFLSNSQDA